MRSRLLLLLSLIVLPPLLLLGIQAWFPANYALSSLYKLVYVAPLIFRVCVRKNSWRAAVGEGFSYQIFKEKLLPSSIIGFTIFAIYGLGFILFSGMIDTQGIVDNLKATLDLSAANLVVIALYIIVVNSLLEEYFWRGFIWKEIRAVSPVWFAHAVSALGFACYHALFFFSWFPWTFVVLAVAALVFFGIMMNMLFAKWKDLFSLWLIHAFADLAQMLIAFRLFGLI